MRECSRTSLRRRADEIGYLPVTTEITSLPQLTPEALPLALARRAAEATRMAEAVTELEARGEAVTSRALAKAAQISQNTACSGLRPRRIRRTGDGSSVIRCAIELS